MFDECESKRHSNLQIIKKNEQSFEDTAHYYESEIKNRSTTLYIAKEKQRYNLMNWLIVKIALTVKDEKYNTNLFKIRKEVEIIFVITLETCQVTELYHWNTINS